MAFLSSQVNRLRGPSGSNFPTSNPTPIGTTPQAPAVPQTPGSFGAAPPKVKSLGGVQPAVNYQTQGQPQTGGFIPMQSFGPQRNLIGSQIAPSTPFQKVAANIGQSGSIYDQLLKMTQNGSNSFGGGGGGAQLNTQLQPLLDKVVNAPDRGKLATDLYGVLEERAQPGFEQRLRSVGQRAAALGRVRAGMTTNELTDVETQHNRDLDLSRRQLAAEGAGQTLDDRLKQLAAGRDVYGSVSAANNAGIRSAQDLDAQRFNNLLTLGRDIYGRESDTFGRDVSERNMGYGYDQGARDELRGERGYQYGLERDALGDRERQLANEEDIYGRDWDRAMQMAQFGYGQNPAGAYSSAGAGARSQAQATQSQIAPMFYEWAKRNRGGAVQPQPTPYDDAAV